MVASAIRLVFEQPDERSARSQVDAVLEGLRPRFAAVADLLADAEPDLLSHFSFPETHRAKIRSTNPLERLARRSSAGPRWSGSSPIGRPSLRLVGMILAEQDDEWQDGRRYFRPETMAAIDAVTTIEEASQPLLMAS